MVDHNVHHRRGPRFSIRNVSFNGNEKFQMAELSKGLEQVNGKPFNQTTLDHDLTAIRDVYGTHGYIFSDVQAETRLLEDKPEMDLIYTRITKASATALAKSTSTSTATIRTTKHATVYDRLSLHLATSSTPKNPRRRAPVAGQRAVQRPIPPRAARRKLRLTSRILRRTTTIALSRSGQTGGPGSRPGAASRFGYTVQLQRRRQQSNEPRRTWKRLRQAAWALAPVTVRAVLTTIIEVSRLDDDEVLVDVTA